MAKADWIGAIGARSTGRYPFEARSRKRPPLGAPTRVEHIQFDYQRWEGPRLRWKEDFGKGRGQVRSLDDADPLRSCNEVEVAKRLRTVRDHAYWFSGYNPTAIPDIWRPWVLSLRGAVPEWLSRLDRRIRTWVDSPAGGMPDVVAWSDSDALRSALFVECKGISEPFDDAQEDWVWVARRASVRVSQIAVSVRPF